MNERFIVFVLLHIWLLTAFNETTLFGVKTEPIANYGIIDKRSVFINIVKRPDLQPFMVSNRLDESNFWRIFHKLFRIIVKSLAGDTGNKKAGSFLQKRLPSHISFPCPTYGHRSLTVPDSVHKLRPGDIDIVAAMGDSITAATGANAINFLEAAVENRGLSFSIGGQGTFRTHVTLPNILREFNPQLIGYSLKDAFSEDRAAQFNLAENIATTSDMPYMAYKLLRRMRLDRRVNMNLHWKMVTIMIGANDFCREICNRRESLLQINQDQETNIINTLRIIRDTMPRTFVNLVANPLIGLVMSMDRLNLPFACKIGRMFFCPCFEAPKFSNLRNLYTMLEQNYHRIFERVAHRPEFHTKDFTVVFQPFGVNATVFPTKRRPDTSIMAYDCVHLSQKGHAVAANALWNNLLQEETDKTMGFMKLFQFECPNEENPYLRTYLNSQQQPVRIW